MAKSKGRVSSIKVQVNALVCDFFISSSNLPYPARFLHLNLQILGARNLPIMDFRKSDPYCKFRFTDIVKKSTVKRGELNPTWAESFIFKIADQSAELPVGGKTQMHFLPPNSKFQLTKDDWFCNICPC